jgi:hypothetical protein
MFLKDCTAAELQFLRTTVMTPGSKIKFLALYRLDDRVLVIAQAKDKLSINMWRENLLSRLQNIVPVGNMRSAIEDAKTQDGFEQFGFFHKRDEAKEGQEPTGYSCVDTETLLAAHKSFQTTFKIWDQLLHSTVTLQRICPSCRVVGPRPSRPTPSGPDPRPDPTPTPHPIC